VLIEVRFNAKGEFYMKCAVFIEILVVFLFVSSGQGFAQIYNQTCLGMLYTYYCWEDIDAYYNASLGAVEVFYSDDIMLGAGFAYKINDNLTT